jgi:hypothetical protein
MLSCLVESTKIKKKKKIEWVTIFSKLKLYGDMF